MRLNIFYAVTAFTFSILAFFYFRLFIVNELNCYLVSNFWNKVTIKGQRMAVTMIAAETCAVAASLT